jgi:UMF1 family MFS transporter
MGSSVSRSATRKERWAWYLYDFGNSAYAAVVLLAVYSAYFQGKVVGGARGSALWGTAVGIAMLVVAVTAPFLGTVADFSGAKKKFLFFFTAMSIFFTATLFFAKPGRVLIGMVAFILAEIGYRSAQVFYNGLLPEIAAPDEVGKVSGTGWAIGTTGGVVALLIILPLIMVFKGLFMVRLSLPITAAFWALASIPIFLWLPERAQPQPMPPGENYLTIAFKRLGATIKSASKFKEFLKFITAFLIYNDGVIMALDFAAIIGAVLFGLNQQDLIVFVIIVQVANAIGAYIFGLMTRWIGVMKALIASIVLMIAGVSWLIFAHSRLEFYLIGIVVGFAMAGVQSISRGMVSLFSPKGKSAEFYGFFAVTGRTSSFIGPAVFGWFAALATGWYQSHGLAKTAAEQAGHRIAVLSIVAFLLAGLLVLLTVRTPEAEAVPAEVDGVVPEAECEGC